MVDIKKKTLYTAYSRGLSMVIGIVSQFVLTPIILSYLGTALYGIYTIVNKANNFLSIVDIRPTAILRLKLAHDQISSDLEEKRMYIGASYVISVLFIPIFIIGGCLLAYFFPEWFHIDTDYVSEARIAIILLSIFLASNGFLGIPEAILRGNNLEYKGFFVEPIRLLLVAGLTIMFLYWKCGILSVVFAMFLGALFAYLVRWMLCRNFLSEYTAKKPKTSQVKYFFNKGGWYLCASFLMQIINNFDVILVGVLMNPETVAMFAITKSIIFRLVESVENLVTSATSSVGEIVGSKEENRIHLARINLFNIVWPLALLFTSYFYVFNEALITFWTSSSVYAGDAVNMVICISAIFLMLTCTEEIFILSSLNFKKKSMYLLISAVIAIIISCALNKPLGLIGNAIGILSGRVVLFFLYNQYNNAWIGKRLTVHLSYILKSLGLILLTVSINYGIGTFISQSLFYFILCTIGFFIVIGLYTYFCLFSENERGQIKKIVFKKI